ncbi:glutaredoxin family protein, partial [Actinomadura vinacea]|uniref:glutaredoxin family protein n=1 Tax=Actinomadura vinacea TaxID=115336 RepID=UPI003CD05F04
PAQGARRARTADPVSAADVMITMYGKPGCHLCEDARAVIERVAADLGVGWEERDITRSEEDTRRYWEQIPVTLINGVQHDFWRVDEDRLRSAIAQLRNPE